MSLSDVKSVCLHVAASAWALLSWACLLKGLDKASCAISGVAYNTWKLLRMLAKVSLTLQLPPSLAFSVGRTVCVFSEVQGL